MTKTSEVSEIHTMLFELANELSQLVVREHQILQKEMQQVQVLVSDAVKNLDSNFRGLDSKASEQADILDEVFQSCQVSDDQQKKLKDITHQINSHTSTTIRSLQFDDIVQQLAGHTCNRISQMQDLFLEFEDKLAIISQLDVGDTDAISERVQMLREEVACLRTRLEKENPVRQHSMDAGKIELF